MPNARPSVVARRQRASLAGAACSPAGPEDRQAPAPAGPGVTVFEGARLIVGDGHVIEDATFIVDGADHMTLDAGSRLGAYEITGPLGSGGMGEVYRARDRRLDREVAIKVLPWSLSDDPQRRARFEREARLLASLDHPHIAVVYAFEEHAAGGKTTSALVMELVDGLTLADRIARGPLPVDEARNIAKQIAQALEAAHEHGIVHRDLKPDNVKVRSDGTVKVLDFGLAKVLAPVESGDTPESPTITVAATRAGQILGTPAYMAPEQARGDSVDRSADLWAFGCVLYEMLTGRRAFQGDGPAEVIAAVLGSEPDWDRVPSETPAAALMLLRQCLHKQPRNRLADARAARLILEHAMAETHPAVPATAPGRRFVRGARAASVYGLLTGLLAMAVLFLVLDSYILERHADAGAGVAIDVAPNVLPNSIAVVPFESLGADADFTAGVHWEIQNQLVRLTSLNPISHATMTRYAGTEKTVREIGRELNVQAVMGGSVWRSGDRVLVRVWLNDAETDVQLWGDGFEEEFKDVYAIQRNIATEVALALDVELSPAEQDGLPQAPPTASAEAYELYLAAQGMASRTANAYEGFSGAIARFDRALAIDPDFAEAWIAKSNAHAIVSGVVEDGASELAAAERAALRALAIDGTPDSVRAAALAALSNTLGQQGDWGRARDEWQRALRLGASVAQNPFHAVQQMAVGDFAGARDTLEANLAVNPMNHVAAGFLLAVYNVLGDTAARQEGYARGETLFGDWFGDQIEMLLRLGDRDEAFLRAFDASAFGDPVVSIMRAGRQHVGATENGVAALRDVLASTESPSAVMLLHAAAWASYFGDAEYALELARRATTRQPSTVMYLWQPLFRDVRRQPVFAELVRDLQLVPYWGRHGWPEFCRSLGADGVQCG